MIRETWFLQVDLSWRTLISPPCMQIIRFLILFLQARMCKGKIKLTAEKLDEMVDYYTDWFIHIFKITDFLSLSMCSNTNINNKTNSLWNWNVNALCIEWLQHQHLFLYTLHIAALILEQNYVAHSAKAAKQMESYHMIL